MKFRVYRTSQGSGENPGFNAVPEIATYHDFRYCQTPEECGETKDSWHNRGIGHYKNTEGIGRYLEPEAIYTLTINTLDELLVFITMTGDVILRPETMYPLAVQFELEIYDDYRE